MTKKSSSKKSFLRSIVGGMLIALFALAAFVICIGFVPFSNKTIKNRAERLLSESLNGRFTIDKLTITLWTGATLKNVRFRSNDSSSLSCHFPRIAVSYHILPLFTKHLIIKNISMRKPEIVADILPQAASKKKPAKTFSINDLSRLLGAFPVTVLVKQLSIWDGKANVTREGDPVFDLKGIYCAAKLSLKRGITCETSLHIAEMKAAGKWTATKCKASLTVNGTSAALRECTASLYGGTLSLKGSAQPFEGYLNQLSVSLSGIKLDEWYRGTSTAGELSGKLDASMDFGKSKLIADSLQGKGWLKLSNVVARATPLQKSLVLLLVIPRLSALQFDRMSIDLLLKNGKCLTRNFSGKGDPIDLTADGWVDLKGRISEKVKGVFSVDFSRDLPALVRNSLLPVEGDQDRRWFQCTVSGTMKNPQLSVDQKIVNRAVNNVFQSIGKSLGNLFGK